MSPPIPQIPLWLKSLAIQWVEKPNLWGGITLLQNSISHLILQLLPEVRIDPLARHAWLMDETRNQNI